MLSIKRLFLPVAASAAMDELHKALRQSPTSGMIAFNFSDESNSITSPAVVVDTVALANSWSTLSLAEKLTEVDSRIELLDSSRDVRSDAMIQAEGITLTFPSNGDPVERAAEINRRSQRKLGVLRGELLSTNLDLVEQFVSELMDCGDRKWSSLAIAAYHGMIRSLLQRDLPLALEVAANASLPPLNSMLNLLVAKEVVVDVPQAGCNEKKLPFAEARIFDAGNNTAKVHEFIGRFAAKDALLIASHTLATHTALRLRKFGRDSSISQDKRDACVRLMKDIVVEYRVDPTTIFSSSLVALQEWCARVTRNCRSPHERAAALMKRIEADMILPKVLGVDAFSVLCMTDIERLWLRSILRPAPSSAVQSSASTAYLRETHQLVTMDPKRWLVDARLLKEYADLLSANAIDCTDKASCFAAFLDECGDCHDETDRPETFLFSFEVTQSQEERCVSSAQMESFFRHHLRALAPQCSFWATLLETSFGDRVRVERCTPTLNGVWITTRVTLKGLVHEALNHTDIIPTFPTVLFEDDHVLCLDKPPGLPTTRHALCCTQRKGEPLTDLVSVVLATPKYGALLGQNKDLFRSGQLHRLDIETSGVIMMAKTPEAMNSLRHQIGTSAEFGYYPKVYHALCLVLTDDLASISMSGTLRDKVDPRVTTRYHVVKFFPKYRVAFVECRIQQGKKHQIRRHLANHGLPILQDVDYGGGACCTPLMDRVALHASSQTFVHPVSQRVMCVNAPLPVDFVAALELLKQ